MCQSENFPCGECKSCQLFEQGSNPDFQEIYSEDKSISVEDTRELLKGLVIRPLYSKYKVIIINDMDRMTIQAQNALLKSLEEPPHYVVFILTARSAAAITPTILSRCQRILFDKLSNDEILGILELKYGKKNTDWDFIVSYADGVIGTALDLIDSPDTIQLRADILEAISQLISTNNTDLFQIYNIFEKNSDKVEYILSVILLYFRDILIYNMTDNFTLLINSDKKDMIIKNAGMSYSSLIKCIQTVWDTQRSLKSNVNFQLAIDVMLMKIKEESL
jgi:DNA polymerase-3 subunit delta'